MVPENKTDEEYRLLAEDFKERYEELLHLKSVEVEKNVEYYKLLCMCYSLFRLSDDRLEIVLEEPENRNVDWIKELSILSKMGRTEISEILETSIL